MQIILLITFAILSFSPFKSVDQKGNSVTPTVMEANNSISSLKLKAKNFTSNFSNAQNLVDLVYKLQSPIYFNSVNLKTLGDNPKHHYTASNSLAGISNASLTKNTIELVIKKIYRINGLNYNINLSLYPDFHKLNNICILSSLKVPTLK